MKSALAAGLCGCTLLLGAAPLRAQPKSEVLKVVPDSALGVVVINRLKDTSDRLEALGRNLQIGIPSPPLGFLKAIAGVSEGVDEQGSLAIALFSAGEGAPPIGALFIPVADYAKFLARLDPKDADAEIARVSLFYRPALVIHKAGFAIVVDARQEKLLNDIQASTIGIDKLVEPLGHWLLEQSIAGLSLEPGTEAALDWLRQVYQRVEAADATPAKGEMPIATLFETIKQLKGEIARVGLGIELAQRDAIVSIKAAFKPGGRIAQEIETTKWPAAPALDAWPAGEFVVADAGILPRGWMALAAHAKLALLEQTAGLSPEQQTQLDQTLADLFGPIESMAMLLRPPITGRSLLNQLTVVLNVDNAQTFLPNYEKNLQTLEKLLQASKSTPAISKVKQVELDHMAALEVEVDLSAVVPESKEPDASTATIMETLLGSERQFTMLIAVVDQHRLAVSYGTRSGVLETAKALRSGKLLVADANVRKALALLPKKSTWVGLADLTGVVQVLNKVLPAVAPAARKLPEFPKALPVAFRAQFTPLEFDARLVLPTELSVKLGDYRTKVRQLQQED